MAIQLELKPEVETRVIEEAKAKGVPVEDFLASVIEGNLNGGTPRPIVTQETITSDELFLADMREFAEGTDGLPAYTGTYSREDIYLDHD